MSRENVERLREFLEPWGRKPWTPEAWERGEVVDMSFLDPNVVYEDENLPDHIGEAYRGHEGIRRAARRWVEPNEWLLVELKRIVGQGDRLVSIHRVRNKARYSGIEFDAPLAYAWTFRNGKIVHFQSFRDPDDALQAAGLRKQAMSQENVDLVRRAVAAVNARDIDRYLAGCTEDVELRTPLAPIGGVYEGPDAIRRFFADIEDTAPDFRLDLERVEAIDEDRVLAFLHLTASGRTTGIPTPADTTNLYDFVDGKISRIRIFLDRQEGLEAAGLRE